MQFTEWLRTVLLGVLGGITKWLPLSDSAHLFLLNRIWGESPAFSAPYTELLTMVTELGAVLALAVTFFHKLNPISQFKTEDQKRNTRSLLKKIAVAGVLILPVTVLRTVFGAETDAFFGSTYVVSAMLVLVGAFMLFTERRIFKRDPEIVKISEISCKNLWPVGLVMCLSVIPGGDSVSLGIALLLSLSYSRYVAAEMSFYMAIPLVILRFVGVTVRFFVFWKTPLSGSMIFGLIAAFGASMLSSFFVIRPFLHYLKRHSLKPFAVYRMALGLFTLIVSVVR